MYAENLVIISYYKFLMGTLLAFLVKRVKEIEHKGY